MKKKLLVIGESYMNLQMHTSPVAKGENMTYGDSYSFHPYGAGATTAISAAKTGADCSFCTRVGADQNGDRLKKYYKGCGLDTSLVATDNEAQTGMSVTIYDDSDGHTYVTKGANLSITQKDIEDAFSCCPDMFIVPQDDLLPEVKTESKTESVGEDADFSETLIFSGAEITATEEEIAAKKRALENIIPSSTAQYKRSLALHAVKLAEEKGVSLLVHYGKNSSGLPLNKLSGIEILVISDETLGEIAGFFPSNIDKILRALLPFAAKIHAKYYIVQQGNDKVFVYDGKYYEIITLPAPLKAKAHQESPRMHGTYIGALAARYLETGDIMDACRFAGVASIMTRSKFGCLDHAPTKEEIADFTAEQQ